VRLLYPTLEEPDTVPYLNPETAIQFCRETMRFAAPRPLKEHDWILHTWRLTGLRAKRNARLIPAGGDNHHSKDKLPLVVFSHGLGGDAAVYSYQTMSLAAQGSLVLSVNHQDGSAPVVRTSPAANGENASDTVMTFDFSLGKLWMDGKHVEYVRSRRRKTDYRAKELLAAAEAFLELNDVKENDGGSLPDGISLSGRILTDDVTFMGHSFGGATVLTAANRRPDVVRSVIAHDPAADWMPDDSRRSLFASHLLEGLGANHSFDGGTGGFEEEEDRTAKGRSIHDTNMLLMFSQQWRDKEWAWSHVLEELHRTGRLGPSGDLGGGFSDYRVIRGSNHQEFSDTCMLLPTWLARGVGAAGGRNPIHTAAEIGELTRSYLDRSRTRRRAGERQVIRVSQ